MLDDIIDYKVLFTTTALMISFFYVTHPQKKNKLVSKWN